MGLGAEPQEDQAHLAAGHHAQAHQPAVRGLGGEEGPARGDLAGDRRQQQEKRHHQAAAVGRIGGIEHRKIDAGANQHKEDRGEQGHHGFHRLLDRLGVAGITQNQAAGKGAQGRLQADGRGRKTAEAEHHKRGHDHLPRGLELVEQPIEGRRRRAAQADRHHHKQHRRRHELEDGSNAEALPGGEGHHHRQNHDAEDVIEDGGADHNLAFAAAQHLQLTKHARRDANAGGRHRGASKDRRDRLHPKQAHQAKGAQGKRQQHPGHGHGDRLAPHRHQLIEFTFEAREEEQGIEPQPRQQLQAGEGFVVNLLHGRKRHIGQGAQQLQQAPAELGLGLRRHNPVEAGEAQEHAGEQLAQDRGQLQAHQQLSK